MNETELTVYYSDTDHGGVVYYANFLKWFEIGRTELLRQHGFTFADFEKRGLLAPVVDVHCSYKFPAQYNDVILIKTEVSNIGTTSIDFSYVILRKEDQKLLAEGKTTNVFVDKKTMQPKNIPDAVRSAFQ